MFAEFIEAILLPPGLSILLLGCALFIFNRHKRTAMLLSIIGLVILIIFSLPRTSTFLISSLETYEALDSNAIKQIQGSDSKRALVVLTGGQVSKAAEYGLIDTVNGITLERLSYASWLEDKVSLPILLTGGRTSNHATPEAVLMNQVMLTRYKVAPKWIETESGDLVESARFSSSLLSSAGIEEIVLITHAWHMQRAKSAFEAQNIKVIPAPIGFSQSEPLAGAYAYLPNAKALELSRMAIEQRLSGLWDTLKY